MKSSEIRSRFILFFQNRQHAVLPSASLVTSDSRGITNPTLFNTAGMQPLIPYLLGQTHPQGKRLVDSQKCLRTVDIDDVGDNTHATFFEMLGNWSLGDYFKKEAIEWSFQFLTSKSEGLGLDPQRLYITVFEGDEIAPRDNEAFEIWKKYLPENRIFFMGAKSNWWEAGDNGPCGPDSEMYYDVTPAGLGDLDREQFIQADQKRDVVEIWNDVFMQYEKQNGQIIGQLKNKCIDTGAGLERLAMVMQGVNNIYDTDLFKSTMDLINSNASAGFSREKRIIADHIRAATFIMADGIVPSNTDRGYILRRLLRRAIRYAQVIGLNLPLSDLPTLSAQQYQSVYPEISRSIENIKNEILAEAEKFNKTIAVGVKELAKIASDNISGQEAFKLFSSYGLPIDMIKDYAQEKGKTVDQAGFEQEYHKHQELSRLGAEDKFRGGLADMSDPMVVKYHTATHILHQALCDILGNEVAQKGSNITSERLRFDFAYGNKMTNEQKDKVEKIINDVIKKSLPVNMVEMPINQAEATGAKHFFGEKYGDTVKIYYIGPSLEKAYSKEYCGGPHVMNTSELSGPDGQWKFVIQKEEAVAQGIRRIKAVLR